MKKRIFTYTSTGRVFITDGERQVQSGTSQCDWDYFWEMMEAYVAQGFEITINFIR